MLLDKYNIKLKGIIHIGAHYGEEYVIYKQLDTKNLMFFEPLSKNFKVLKENVSDEVQCYNLALGNKTCDIEMYVEHTNQSRSSSVLKPKYHLTQYPGIQFTDIETVKMCKLDHIEFNKSDYNVIIIDVQGYELEVLKGSSDFLNNVDLIISEINIEEMYENCVLTDELCDFLSKYKFKMVEKYCPHSTWGDGIFIKKS
jgi:hypothetical protein